MISIQIPFIFVFIVCVVLVVWSIIRAFQTKDYSASYLAILAMAIMIVFGLAQRLG